MNEILTEHDYVGILGIPCDALAADHPDTASTPFGGVSGYSGILKTVPSCFKNRSKTTRVERWAISA
jgi:hypothetical protein